MQATAIDVAEAVFSMAKVSTPEGTITGVMIDNGGLRFRYADGRISEYFQNTDAVEVTE